MKRLTLSMLAPLAFAAACDADRAPTAIDAVVMAPAAYKGGQPAFVPFTVRETFGVAPNAAPLLCAPAAAQVAIPDLYISGGVASHLGKTSSLVTFETCALIMPVGTGATVTGHIVMTAANGDELHSTFVMTQDAAGPFELDSFTITGGTGRFANASGSGSGSGWIDVSTLNGYWHARGTMSSPGQ